jgi:cell division protein FtsB
VLVRAAVASLVLVGVLFAFVFPTRSWLHQRGVEGDARSQLDLLRERTKQLEDKARRLRSDVEVKDVARARYGFVSPGEQAWAVVPPLASTTTTTSAPPASQP